MSERTLFRDLFRSQGILDIQDSLYDAANLLEVVRVGLFLASQDQYGTVSQRFLDGLGLLTWMVQEMIEASLDGISKCRSKCLNCCQR